MKTERLAIAIVALTALGPGYAPAGDAMDDLREALIGGRPDVFLRYRFEHVDDGTPGPRDAYASTLRTALGYHTGSFRDLGFYLQIEDVRVLGNDAYDDGGANGVFDRAEVVDPEGTELQQAYLRYEGLPKTVLRIGRQEINHREPPFNRYVGNILWRQNWQSFDGLRAINLSLPDSVADYAYIWNVNRIFGEDNPLPDRSDFRLDGHLLNVQYSGLRWAKAEGYAYLLDFDSPSAARFSTATVGLRLKGDQDILPGFRWTYAGEYAHQSDYGDNPNEVAVGYFLGELGARYAIGKVLDSVALTLCYEVLEGDGQEAFQTPLGTNHAFQGWADRFLVTPGDGVEDLFVTLKATALGTTLIVVYHDFAANDGGYDYGHEWDIQLERPLFENALVGVKFAAYQADANAENLARNRSTGQAFDLTKSWAYVQIRF